MAVLELDFADAEVGVPLEPDIGDFAVRNDVTAVRRQGSSATAVDEDGPLGVDAVGRYKTRVDINPASDGDLPDHATWHLALGTIEDARFPQVTVDLDANPSLAAETSAVDAGDLIRISNLPDDLVPDTAELVVTGYSETVESHRRLIVFNTLPATIYQHVFVLGDAVRGRLASGGSELASPITAVATSLLVVTDSGKQPWTSDPAQWTVPGKGLLYVTLGREVVQVTNVDSDISPQTMTVVRSVNGVIKPHSAGTRVQVAKTVVAL